MSEGKQKLDRFIVARIRKLWAQMAKPGLSFQEQSKLSREIDLLGRRMSAKPDPSAEESEAIAFIEQLETRQGTMHTDFQLLYEKKAELDRKFLDRHNP